MFWVLRCKEISAIFLELVNVLVIDEEVAHADYSGDADNDSR